ncbi:FAD:protein FMN transferase [Marinomonas sp. 15G1-11]|uniref:FAD:protein FMN transferase n=1 Tax=Marinomonas phaeophyticola TaxID=3004091 RepID=A0ABT4JWR1_9GAMM|nr:FAD:protein FMN transferase [Marinomonas sp. 15G1-11]MCZ2722800.1 FAD:protein FMN transferase [Marinomonas sp. 15G1-11]
MRKKIVLILAPVIVLLLLIKGMTFSPELVSFSGPTMGTTYTVKFYTVESGGNVQSLKDDVDSVLLRINQLMSTYDPSSDLSLFNKMPSGSKQEVSSEFAYVVDKALLISTMSDGYYDVTVGPLANLWGFGPDKSRDEPPTDEKINDAKQKVGYQNLLLSGNVLSKEKDIYVDLSSIAKGYGVDAIANKLDENGIESYLIEVGGEIRSKGKKEDGGSWKIAIESPAGGHNVAQLIIDVDDLAIATSGDYRNYFEKNGVRYSHIINPKTGRPITHKLVSVTIIDKTAVMADGLATAITVLGPDKGLEFAEKHGIAAYLMIKKDFGYEERVSTAFEPYLKTSIK